MRKATKATMAYARGITEGRRLERDDMIAALKLRLMETSEPTSNLAVLTMAVNAVLGCHVGGVARLKNRHEADCGGAA